ncbi:MAG: hypothetical protein WD076_00285 [Parvularculaceae bacterium]
MVILRLSGELPPEMEIELYRATSGETVKWAGRSSGVIEQLQGWVLVGVGAIFALANIAGPAAALGMIVNLAERGRAPDIDLLVSTLIGIAFFAGGVIAALFGWRFVTSAHQVIWAVTNRRLVRIVAGSGDEPRSWSKSDIVSVERMNWDDPEKRILAVAVKSSGRTNAVLLIVGPVDLEAAERALAEIEG